MKTTLLSIIFAVPFLVSGCAIVDAVQGLDGESKQVTQYVDTSCRGYALVLETAADFKSEMSEEQVSMVDKVRTELNRICTSPNPPTNDLETVESGVLTLWGLVASFQFNESEEVTE